MKNKKFFCASLIIGLLIMGNTVFAEKNLTDTEKYLMDNTKTYSSDRYDRDRYDRDRNYDRYDRDRYYDRYDRDRYYDRYDRDRYYDRYDRYKYYDRYDRYEDANYTSYYNNGRYYYSKDYTYIDSDGYKHFVNLKYYYDSVGDRVYSVYDYYYDKNNKKVVTENRNEFTDDDRDYEYSEKYNRRQDIFSQNSYYRDYKNNKDYYIYKDTYYRDSKKHYVSIEYYYENGKKVYDIEDYYFENGKRYNQVDVEEKKLSDSDLRYYLEDYLDSNDYNDRYYRDDRYYYNDRYYNDRYYRDDRYRYDRYRDWDIRDRYYREYKYTNFNDYIDKINNLRYVGYGGYYYYDRYNDRYYREDDRYYYKTDYSNNYSIADYFPADFAPSEKTWPKKSDLTQRKKDTERELAIQIEHERSYMGKDYFEQKVVNNLLNKYFPNSAKDCTSDRQRLQAFLYHFGFVDALLDRHIDEKDVRGFLYNYGEPMFLILKYYYTEYYTDDDINSMRRGQYKSTDEDKKTIEKNTGTSGFVSERENHYFSEKNRLIQNERR